MRKTKRGWFIEPILYSKETPATCRIYIRKAKNSRDALKKARLRMSCLRKIPTSRLKAYNFKTGKVSRWGYGVRQAKYRKHLHG